MVKEMPHNNKPVEGGWAIRSARGKGIFGRVAIGWREQEDIVVVVIVVEGGHVAADDNNVSHRDQRPHRGGGGVGGRC